MKTVHQFLTLTLAGLVFAAALSAQTPITAAPPVDASSPLPKRGNARFYELHASFLNRATEGPVGVLFLGDSITEQWGTVPKIWTEHFGLYQPANFGISGDQTQHVIWRIEDGELDGIRPKVVVLMLGTNNSSRHTGQEIAAANRKVIALIRGKLPETKVLVLAIFPRGPRQNRDGTMDQLEPRLEAIRIANAELAQLDDGQTVRFLDIGAKFLDSAGRIPDEIMPDQLHLSPAGYRIWAEAMGPLLAEMMH